MDDGCGESFVNKLLIDDMLKMTYNKNRKD